MSHWDESEYVDAEGSLEARNFPLPSTLFDYAFGRGTRAGIAILSNDAGGFEGLDRPLELDGVRWTLEVCLVAEVIRAGDDRQLRALKRLTTQVDVPGVVGSITAAHQRLFYTWKHDEDLGRIHDLVLAGESEKLAEAVVEGGADADDGLLSPLHLAAGISDAKMAQALIAAGARVDCFDGFGRTPLHHASERGADEVVRALVERGADAAIQCQSGKTPLMLAAGHGSRTCVFLLLPLCDSSAKDSGGKSAADNAREDWPQLASELDAFARAQVEKADLRRSLASIASASPPFQPL